MTTVYFIYGLAFFCLGLVVLLESRHASGLALSRHLPWLAAFGITHGLVEWFDMFLAMPIELLPPAPAALALARGMLLPVSGVLLLRFGAGLIGEAGPLPDWLMLAPVALIVPGGLAAAYVIIMALTQPPLPLAADILSRYLLYGPGCVAAALGLLRQRRRLPQLGLEQTGSLFTAAAAAFAFNGLVGGLLVPPADSGLASWLNSDLAMLVSGWPVQVWRAISAVTVTLLVIRAMDVFDAERQHQLQRLRADNEQAQRDNLQSQQQARQAAEGWTEALVNISRRMAGIAGIDQVLPAILQAAHQLLRADCAGLALWNDDGTRLEVRFTARGPLLPAPSFGEEQVQNADRDETGTARPSAALPLLVDDPVVLRCVRDGAPALAPQPGGGAWWCPVDRQPVAAACIVPLRLDQQSLGALWVSRRAGPAFSPADETGLGHLADQAVIALEQALMAARLQSLAVVEERGRIAREMHDGLSQVLGYLSLETQTIEALLRQGQQANALNQLAQARSHIRDAQDDVREGILSLRTTLSGDVGLLPAMQQYVDEFEVQTGIQARLVSELPGHPSLSPLAEAQLVRIAQEALTNVRKHARAGQVQLRLGQASGQLRLTIADNGRGFDAAAVGRGHYGLQTMRERAESVGGSVCVGSTPGTGTHVEVLLPMVAN